MLRALGRNSFSNYGADKEGLKMLIKNLATEWAKHIIQVNDIVHGCFAILETEPIRVDGHPFKEFIINRTPAAIWVRSEGLSWRAVFSASSESDFVNGHIVYVDGVILATIGKPSNEN